MVKFDILRNWLLHFIVISLITSCTTIKPFKHLDYYNPYVKPPHLKGEIYYKDSLYIFFISGKIKNAPIAHTQYIFMVSPSTGILTVNKDTTIIELKDIENNTTMILKKSLLGWNMSGAYKIKLKYLEFIEYNDDKFSMESFSESKENRDSIRRLPSINLAPKQITNLDFINRGILLRKNKTYAQIVYGVVFSYGKYYEENGYLVLVENRTTNTYRLKILNNGEYVVDWINNCFDRIPIYTIDE